MTTPPPRKVTSLSLALVSLLAAGPTLSACNADRHLIGEGSTTSDPLAVDGGNNTGGSSAGIGAAGNPPAPSNGSDAGAVDTTTSQTPPSAGPRALVISPREVVRRLSVVLWKQPSDPALIAEADAGGIKNTEDVRKLALRMLDDPRARDGVGRFYRWWLDQDQLLAKSKDVALFPEFTTQLKVDMARETELFGVHLTLDLNANVSALFTASFGFPNERLAPLYGLTGFAGVEHQKTTVSADRAGVLTLPGMMAVTSLEKRVAPTKRGSFVSDKFLCSPVPPPPPGIPALPEGPGTENLTTREKLASLQDPSCQGCHSLTDPFGFALDGFDVLGRQRTTENGKPINTTATITRADLSASVMGARELAQLFASRTAPADCFVEKWLLFATAQPFLNTTTRNNLTVLVQDAKGAGYNIRQIIAIVMQSDVFLARETLL
jgi:hypothetical protein